MALTTLSVLYEDNHLLAVVKPAGLPTMGTAANRSSLVTWARDYLKRKYHKPGNVYVGVVSRVDSLVTGVVVLARTSKAAARLAEQFRSGTVRKTYWALVEGTPEPAAGTCLDWLRKDERQQRMQVVRPHVPGAKEARLEYRILQRLGRTTLIEVSLATGRKHQIRLQLAHRGHPIVGDRKYGATAPFAAGIGLHSRELELLHPVGQKPLRLVAPLPDTWRDHGVRDAPP
jgi:23S rRNA pseudouridine1911/1915/1917 synthase